MGILKPQISPFRDTQNKFAYSKRTYAFPMGYWSRDCGKRIGW